MEIDPQDLQRYRQMATRTEAREAFDRITARAQRSLALFDDRGEFWGLERKAFADAAASLLARNRDASITIVVHDLAHIERHCPRLSMLLRTHSPRFRVLQSDMSVRAYSRGLVIADDTVVLRRAHFGQPASFLDFDEAEVAASGKLFAELIDSALPGVSAQVTGL